MMSTSCLFITHYSKGDGLHQWGRLEYKFINYKLHRVFLKALSGHYYVVKLWCFFIPQLQGRNQFREISLQKQNNYLFGDTVARYSVSKGTE